MSQTGWSAAENHTAPSPSPTPRLVRGGDDVSIPSYQGGAGRDNGADGVVGCDENQNRKPHHPGAARHPSS
jgi:hypothetical protein